MIAFAITLFVAISRVYFMCHWIGDTIVAMFIETPIAIILIYLRNPIVEFAKSILTRF